MADDLPGCLAAGERAAFHGRPAAGVTPLQQAVERRTRAAATTRPPPPRGCWVSRWARPGGTAARSPCSSRCPSAPAAAHPARRLFASLAASTAASVHRQLGRHAAARALDERAVELAGDAAEALFDARLGLAADAVGLGELAPARAELDAATALLEGRADWWRQQVRPCGCAPRSRCWPATRRAAAKAADGAVTLAEGSRGAPARGEEPAVPRASPRSRAASPPRRPRRCAGPRRWPRGWAACRWSGPRGPCWAPCSRGRTPPESAKNLAAARSAVITIADDLPEGLRDEWLARPDVGALMGG